MRMAANCLRCKLGSILSVSLNVLAGRGATDVLDNSVALCGGAEDIGNESDVDDD